MLDLWCALATLALLALAVPWVAVALAEQPVLVLAHSTVTPGSVNLTALTVTVRAPECSTIPVVTAPVGVLDVVDAQTTLITARNAYADGQVRYRNALASLQILTGSF